MYYRIKNSLDARMLAEKINGNVKDSIVAERIVEQIEVLDDAYGRHRTPYAMGGYILYFPNEKDYNKMIGEICEFYNISLNEYEYSEIIGEKPIGNTEWWEELFMLSSDDALVMIHPKEVNQ